jgi:hypothetical protein
LALPGRPSPKHRIERYGKRSLQTVTRQRVPLSFHGVSFGAVRLQSDDTGSFLSAGIVNSYQSVSYWDCNPKL